MNNIVITGASRGIGYETVLLLSKNPQNQIIALSRNTEPLKKLGLPNVHAFDFDLANFDTDLINVIRNRFGEIHVLINNAGLLLNQPFIELSEKAWLEIFQVNFFGAVKLINLLLPCMGKSRKAHIVNIGSMGGFQGSVKFSGLSAYSTSKAALANLTECLAVELEDKNIAINCLALGAVESEMFREAFPTASAPLKDRQMAEHLVWFAENGHRFYQGKILPVALSTP
ncbi:MAG: SDR family oxidoreductase [Thermoflexibacter sp.]